MNRQDKNISNAAGDRRTYLSPRTEIIKMATSNLIMGSAIEIPIDSPGALDANGKKWQGDFDSWDEENTWDDSETFGTYGW
ncbi:hypothetical protein HMPREF0645_1368 [Hallella bergensis DSM 17361]|uniref:Uncharacterized protein n=1 Tax=Hallella bergensis DSM 17361 TaxID=585502 RepID=D1PWN3_9BACT|nr:hypothetical protein [Hallella bergensis]EFA44214.1 hypothetical protein HMPREF0645_1368 [Hallella bergensis DSM 17361]